MWGHKIRVVSFNLPSRIETSLPLSSLKKPYALVRQYDSG
jgi:hypothetical protein